MKKIAYLLFVFVPVLIFTSCNQDEEIIDLSSLNKPDTVKENLKVDICHYDEYTGEFYTINVSENAVEAHLAHGDILGNCDDIITICYNDETIRVDKHTLENYVPFTFGDCETGPEPGEEYTYVPDDNFEQKLISLGWDDELDNIVLTSNIELKTYLDVSNLNIDDLTGINGFIKLVQLNCINNNLIILDLSKNTKLKIVDCYSNQLESINLSNSDEITRLNCANNQLTDLDLSNKSSLTSLTCSNNLLSALNITDNNSLVNLNCFSNQLTEINVLDKEDLKTLVCSSNQLTSLDVTTNTNLVTLNAYSNQIKDLDLSNNTILKYLYCYSNGLERLNVQNGNNTNLIFNANSNPITCFQVDDAIYSTDNWTIAYTYTEDCY